MLPGPGPSTPGVKSLCHHIVTLARFLKLPQLNKSLTCKMGTMVGLPPEITVRFTWSNSELMNKYSDRSCGLGPQHLMFETRGDSEMLAVLCHPVNNVRPLFRSKNQSPTALIWGTCELQGDECTPQGYLEVGGNRMKLRRTLECHSYLCSKTK